MLRKERQNKILDILKFRKSIVVEELAKEFGVSSMTIRRDLDFLADAKIIERHHGGAIICDEEEYDDKKIRFIKDKQKIAKIAAALIYDGSNIFLDAGTTTIEIAKLLFNKNNLTVVTNDIEIAYVLKDANLRLFICGGEISKDTHSVHDYYTKYMLDNFKFDMGFFGANAVNQNLEVTTPTVSKIWIKKELTYKCNKAYLVVDESKFYKQSMNKIQCVYDYDGIITNKIFTKEETEILNSHSTKIYNAIRGEYIER